MVGLRYRRGSRNTLLGFKGDPLSFKPFILPLSLLALGLLSLAGLILKMRYDEAFERTAARAMATVRTVEHPVKKHTKKRSNALPWATLAFAAPDGGTYEVRKKVHATVGQRIELLYQPTDPVGSARVYEPGSSRASTVGMALVVVLFILPGGVLLALVLKRRADAQSLIHHGRIVNARITGSSQRAYSRDEGVGLSLFFSYRYKHERLTTRVTASWHDTSSGEHYEFESSDIPFRPDDSIVGREVEIVIDPANPRRYYFSDAALTDVLS